MKTEKKKNILNVINLKSKWWNREKKKIMKIDEKEKQKLLKFMRSYKNKDNQATNIWPNVLA